jgi:lipoprotein-releasing system permease protein
LVKDKSHDIAILRSIGASRRDIMMIFVINGMMIGIIGTLLGILLGLGFALNIEAIRQFLEKLTGVHLFEAALYFLYHLPAKVEISNVITTSSISLALCLVATILPSLQSCKIRPY